MTDAYTVANRLFHLAIHAHQTLCGKGVKCSCEWKNESDHNGRHMWTAPAHTKWLKVALKVDNHAKVIDGDASTMITHAGLVKRFLEQVHGE